MNRLVKNKGLLVLVIYSLLVSLGFWADVIFINKSKIYFGLILLAPYISLIPQIGLIIMFLGPLMYLFNMLILYVYLGGKKQSSDNTLASLVITIGYILWSIPVGIFANYCIGKWCDMMLLVSASYTIALGGEIDLSNNNNGAFIWAVIINSMLIFLISKGLLSLVVKKNAVKKN